MQITVEKTHDNARLPKYGSNGAACFDLFAAKVVSYKLAEGGSTSLFDNITLDTGLKFDIPEGWVMRVYSRSGHGFNVGVRLCNSTGIIDSDYTGNVKVKLVADMELGKEFLRCLANDVDEGKAIAVAQAEIAPVEYVSFAFGTVDKETARGANGFGSTDKKG